MYVANALLFVLSIMNSNAFAVLSGVEGVIDGVIVILCVILGVIDVVGVTVVVGVTEFVGVID